MADFCGRGLAPPTVASPSLEVRSAPTLGFDGLEQPVRRTQRDRDGIVPDRNMPTA
jgi:hypothetical protein